MLLRSIVLSLFALTLAACNITGSGAKGPFNAGSNVSFSKLTGQALPIPSRTVTTQVDSNQGDYSVNSIDWNGWSQLQVSGQYFNEYDASNSSDVITLDAITKKDRRFDTANVHIFSHFAAARIRYRVANGQNIGRAWRDTQSEMKQLFGLPRVSRNIHRGVEQLSLLNGSGRYRKENANLLLFTGSFLATAGDVSSLAALTSDFADDAQFNGVAADIFHSIAIKGGVSNLLTTLSDNLQSIGVNNPPNNGDMPSLPRWVIEDAGDNTPPVISLNGDNPVTVEVGSTYSDAGATAIDNVDGEVAVTAVDGSDVIDTSIATGEVPFTVAYEAIDVAGNRSTATRTVIVIDPINQIPVADNQTVTIDEDSVGNQITLTGTDGDEDVITFALIIDSGPNNGSLSGEAPDFLYTPNTNFSGTDSFEFTVNDGTDTSASATITIIVNPINDAPTANAGTDVSVQVNNTVTLIGTGTDVDGDNLTYSWSEGEVELATTASFDYTPETGGTHTLTLSVFDGTETTTDQVDVQVLIPDSYQIIFMAGDVPLPTEPPRIETPRNFDSTLFAQTLILIAKVVDSEGNLVLDESEFPLLPDFSADTVDLSTSGLYSVEFSVIDPFHGEITRSLEVNVVNYSPIAVAQNITVDEDSAGNSITLTGTDQNQGDTLVFELIAETGPLNGSLTGTVPNLTYTPNPNFSGSDSFIFSVSDGEELSTATVNITVSSINDAPTVEAGANAVITEGDSYTPTPTSNDVDGTIATTVWREGELILTFPKTDFSIGVHTIQVTVTDNEGLSASDTLTVTVDPKPNTAPVANGQSHTINEDDSISMVLTGNDDDNDELIFTYTQPNTGVVTGIAPNVIFSPVENFNGLASFTFTVSDGQASSTADVNITVASVNDLPTANAGSDTSVQTGSVVTITGTASDIEDGTNVSFLWTEAGNEVPLANTAIFEYTPPSAGVHSLTLTVTDSDGGIATDTVTIDVNAPPTVDAGPNWTMHLGTTIEITGAGQDTDGSIASYSWTDDGVEVATTASFTYSPTTEGIHNLSLTVVDNDGGTATDTINVNVLPSNVAATVNISNNVSVEVNQPVQLSGSASDSDGIIIQYSWIDGSLEGGQLLASGEPNTNTITTDINYSSSVVGEHIITLYVVDDDNAISTASVTVTVTEAAVVGGYTCRATLNSESFFTDNFITEQVDDIPWTLGGTQSPTVSQIEDAFNNARNNEIRSLGPIRSNLDRMALNMPEQAIWDGYTDSQKALFLINSERCARGIRPYEGIAPEVVTSPAQTYAQFLADNEAFGHQEDGRTPWQRLAEDAGAVVGSTADFFSFAENLAFVSSSSTGQFPTIHETVARSIYGYLYADKNDTTDPQSGIASYGHRLFILATGLTENSGVDNQEGLIGMGKSEAQSVVNIAGTDYNQTRVYSVMNGFDPNENWNMSNIQTVNLNAPIACLSGYVLPPIPTSLLGCVPSDGLLLE